MHRLGAAVAAGLHDLARYQIRLGRRGGTDGDRLVRHSDMQRAAVCLGIDRHRGDAHAPRGLDDAAGDFAAICDQYFAEQERPLWGGWRDDRGLR